MRVRRAWILLVITAITSVFALTTGHPMFWRTTYVFLALLAVAAFRLWLMGRGVDVDVRRLSLRSSVGGKVQEKVTISKRSALQQGYPGGLGQDHDAGDFSGSFRQPGRCRRASGGPRNALHAARPLPDRAGLGLHVRPLRLVPSAASRWLSARRPSSKAS